jgi:RNA polymerase subunit RPABC4/transcription elongation factor Spt4
MEGIIMKMKQCKTCNNQIASNAKSCPNCGAKNKKPIYKRAWFIILAVIIVGSIGANLGDSNTVVTTNNSTNTTKQEATNNNDESTKQETTNNNDESTKQSDSKVPAEYTSALKKAEIYSDTMYMSKSGIYNQLTSEHGEKFSEEAAQYAIDNINADWNKNALEKAKVYQDEMSMSPAAIEDQLKSEHGENFTADEASYAVEHLND